MVEVEYGGGPTDFNICVNGSPKFRSIRVDSHVIVIGLSVIFNRRLLVAIYRDANACTVKRS